MLKTAPEPTTTREEGRSYDERRFDSMNVRRIANYYLIHAGAKVSENVCRQAHDSTRIAHAML
jgi:hypothetical protein